MQKPYIDFHCHPSLKPYGRSFKYSPQKQNTINAADKNSIWHRKYPSIIQRRLNQVLTITKFTQTDLSSLANIKSEVIVTALYPFEKHFIIPKVLGSKTLAHWLINFATGISKERINYVLQHNSYFKDLQDEYNFYLQQHNQGIKKGDTYFTYKLVKNYQAIEANLAKNSATRKIINVIPSIEGGHALETGLNKNKDTANETTVLKNIQTVKNWEFPPFFITLAHHYYNELCGHAKSISLGLLKKSQKRGMGTGITKLGYKVIDSLLSQSNGKRILIDIKHLSLLSRKQYYSLLETKYAQKNIPIIVSHGALNGRKSINEPNFRTSKLSVRFCHGEINFFDTEFIRIAKSNGIFALQLDERRIGSKMAIARSKVYWPSEKLRVRQKACLIWRQLEHGAELLNQEGLFCWGTMAIGSDFDGIVNPIKGLWTCEFVNDFRETLVKTAKVYLETHNNKLLPINRITPEEIIDRLLHINATNFLKHYF